MKSIQITLITVPDIRVAVLEHHGDPGLIESSVQQFIQWRKQNHRSPSISATFNILYNDPNQVSPEDYRLDLCAASEAPVVDNPFGIIEKTIPAGRCAMYRHIGSDDGLRDCIYGLYANWLPMSGELLRDFPLYLQRVKFPPEVPAQEAVTDVFLPIV